MHCIFVVDSKCHICRSITFTVTVNNHLNTLLLERCVIVVYVLYRIAIGNIQNFLGNGNTFVWLWKHDTLIWWMNEQIWLNEHWTVALFTLLTFRVFYCICNILFYPPWYSFRWIIFIKYYPWTIFQY